MSICFYLCPFYTKPLAGLIIRSPAARQIPIYRAGSPENFEPEREVPPYGYASQSAGSGFRSTAIFHLLPDERLFRRLFLEFVALEEEREFALDEDFSSYNPLIGTTS